MDGWQVMKAVKGIGCHHVQEQAQDEPDELDAEIDKMSDKEIEASVLASAGSRSNLAEDSGGDTNDFLRRLVRASDRLVEIGLNLFGFAMMLLLAWAFVQAFLR